MKIDDLDPLSLTHLQKNIQALQQINPSLANRLALPVGDDHVKLQNRQIVLTHGRKQYQLNVPLEPLLKDAPIVKEVVFLFGAGSPALVRHVLDQSSVSRLIVWDRDPLLLRILLMERDFSEELTKGRLQLALGIDLIDFAGDNFQIISHPILQDIYFAEYTMLLEGVGTKRVIISPETLYSKEAFTFFYQQGYAVYSLDLRRISLEEIQYTLFKFKPELLFVVNYISGLAELSQKTQIPVACWEIDPFVDRLSRPPASTELCWIFCYRPALVEEFKNAGFKHVYYLPMGADLHLRRPAKLTPQEKEYYHAPVSFVGSSMLEQALNFRKLLLKLYGEFKPGAHHLRQFETNLEEILQIQRDNFTHFVIQELATYYFHDFIQFCEQNRHPDPVVLISEMAASEKRVNYLSVVSPYGLKIWGDKGWQVLESYGATYMGYAGRHHEINKIYTATQINLDVNRLYQNDIVPLRIFDTLACGGFILAEYSEEIERLFDIDNELVCYQNHTDLSKKVHYFLQHPQEARQIAEKGRQAVIEKHAFALRMQKILRHISSAMKKTETTPAHSLA